MSLRGIPLFVLILAVSCAPIFGYIFPCLEQCECDTDDEAIHCHNGNRETLHLPNNRLRGFAVIGLTSNRIKELPSEKVLLHKFPDLKAIDVAGNPSFNCSNLDDYTKVVVMSDCGNAPGHRLNISDLSPKEPTPDCDLACQRDHHLRAIREYLVQLWQLLKKKLVDLKRDNKWMQDVQDFATEWGQKISDTVNNLDEQVHNFLSEEKEASGNATSTYIHMGSAVGRRKGEMTRAERVGEGEGN